MCMKNLFQSENMDVGITTKFNPDQSREKVYS